MRGYFFYLNDVQLPITPSKMVVKVANKNTTIDLIDGSEINILKGAGLREISFDFTLPQTDFHLASGTLSAAFYLDMLRSFKVSKKPVRFVCVRYSPSEALLFESNLLVSLEDYEALEDAENGLDIVVSINLKEYKEYRLQEVSKVVQYVQRSEENAPSALTYTTLKGDCLWNIAKKFLGDGARYMEIYNLNRDKIKSPNTIYAGTVLSLPS